MKKITNRKEANDYYKLIRKEVDDFIKKTKAKPNEVYRYITKNSNGFLDRIGLSEVVGIDSVLRDVISHKKNMEDDAIITFENFNKLNESIINIGSPKIEHEKVLADFFNTSLGHIDIEDPQNFLFKVNDFGNKILVCILNENDLEKINADLVNKITEKIRDFNCSINSVDNFKLSNNLTFRLSDILDLSELKYRVESKMSMEIILDIVKQNIEKTMQDKNAKLNYDTKSEFHIWWYNV